MVFSYIDRWIQHPRNLFLLDSAGGFLTALLIGCVLTHWQEYIGIPMFVLYGLAGVGLFCCVYSFLCAMLVRSQWRRFLRIIVVINGAYCALTLGVLFYFRSQVTLVAMVYFLLEIAVIGGIVALELKAAQRQLR